MHSGYFMCFFMEFLIVYHEDQMLKLMAESPLLSQLTSRAELRPLVYVVCQSFHWLFMGYSLLPFCLLSWEKWVPVSPRGRSGRGGCKSEFPGRSNLMG
ncbi:lysophospholipid acyltransferase 5-like [Hypanus sabinus]|uniref:lysophospholipid acyltransferase 5-like n=1 Tax=Hypanus sabinus TaxID=79690 RepID=UPI0028C486EE|nr:lysophospholipid acyltransferase 5-like [Hypanus sabinus]